MNELKNRSVFLLLPFALVSLLACQKIELGGVNDSSGGNTILSTDDEVQESFDRISATFPVVMARLALFQSDMALVAGKLKSDLFKDLFVQDEDDKVLHAFFLKHGNAIEKAKLRTFKLEPRWCHAGFANTEGAHDASTDEICISQPALRKHYREALDIQILALMAHEFAHSLGEGEEAAAALQTAIANKQSFVLAKGNYFGRDRLTASLPLLSVFYRSALMTYVRSKMKDKYFGPDAVFNADPTDALGKLLLQTITPKSGSALKHTEGIRFQAKEAEWSLSPYVLGRFAILAEKINPESLQKIDTSQSLVYFKQVRELAKIVFEDARKYNSIMKQSNSETQNVIDANLAAKDFLSMDGAIMLNIFNFGDATFESMLPGKIRCNAIFNGKTFAGSMKVGDASRGGVISFEDANIAPLLAKAIEEEYLINTLAPKKINAEGSGLVWALMPSSNANGINPEQSQILTHTFAPHPSLLMPGKITTQKIDYVVMGFRPSHKIETGAVTYQCEVVPAQAEAARGLVGEPSK